MEHAKFYFDLLQKQHNYMKSRCPAYQFYLNLRAVLEDTLSAWSSGVAENLRRYRAANQDCSMERRAASYRRGLALCDLALAYKEVDERRLMEKHKLGPAYDAAQEVQYESYEILYWQGETSDDGAFLRQAIEWLGKTDEAIADLEGCFFCMFGYEHRLSEGLEENRAFTQMLEHELFPGRGSI